MAIPQIIMKILEIASFAIKTDRTACFSKMRTRFSLLPLCLMFQVLHASLLQDCPEVESTLDNFCNNSNNSNNNTMDNNHSGIITDQSRQLHNDGDGYRSSTNTKSTNTHADDYTAYSSRIDNNNQISLKSLRGQVNGDNPGSSDVQKCKNLIFNYCFVEIDAVTPDCNDAKKCVDKFLAGIKEQQRDSTTSYPGTHGQNNTTETKLAHYNTVGTALALSHGLVKSAQAYNTYNLSALASATALEPSLGFAFSVLASMIRLFV